MLDSSLILTSLKHDIQKETTVPFPFQLARIVNIPNKRGRFFWIQHIIWPESLKNTNKSCNTVIACIMWILYIQFPNKNIINNIYEKLLNKVKSRYHACTVLEQGIMPSWRPSPEYQKIAYVHRLLLDLILQCFLTSN